LLPLPHLEEYRIEAIIKTLQQQANATPSTTLAVFTEGRNSPFGDPVRLVRGKYK